ncbi:RcnB family protein [Parasphingorhabdus sp.]|uniref:RcnB family protein n=1 Tax=Parasphingorhabdus sp. TaxID=2709688 RepID=UPI003A8FB962
MKSIVTSIASVVTIALLSSQIPVQAQQKTRSDSRQHTERHRVAPPVKHYDGPTTYRPGTRPRDLDRQRRDANPQTYRYNYRTEKRYRSKPYVRPNGWYSHQWIYGDILPTLFWTRSYWITDFWLFGLPIPPRGYVWVRYGEDALLVQISSGVILQVIYGVYY